MQNNIHQEDATVSIILSESTASLLQLNLPNLENFLEDSKTMLCTIKAIHPQDINAACAPSFHILQAISDKSFDSNRIANEIAYISRRANRSSSSVDIIDDLSEESFESAESNGDEKVLDTVKIYTRPLVAVKTEAHKNRLTASNNNLYLSVMESEISMTESGWMNICRICHGGESIGNLLSPCRCRGSIALAHLSCLERWLKESASSRCELCQHHFHIIREPKYSIPLSILLFLRHPGDHYKDLLMDVIAFLLYTPSAFASTYMLMLLCESIAKTNLQNNRNLTAHIMAFSAIFGIAAIDFTYSSWLIVTLQKQAEAWRSWYRSNCQLKLILPPWKIKRHQRKKKHTTKENRT